MASIEPVHPTKRNVFLSLFAWINRPMLALSVLIHIGLLSIPIPETEPSAPEEPPEEISGITDLSQVTLATAPLEQKTIIPQGGPIPSGLPSLPPVKVDLSRAPRPPQPVPLKPTIVSPRVVQPEISQPAIVQPQVQPQSSSPRPTPRKSPPPAPRVSPVPSIAPGGSAETSPGGNPGNNPGSVPPTALPVTTPPPPPLEETAGIPTETAGSGAEALSEEAARALFDQFRRNSPSAGSGQVYPAALEQPSAFFKPQVQENATATERDCLGLILACWWDEQQNPEAVKQRLQGEALFQNIDLEEISGGYGGGQLYRLVSKTTGEATTWYLTLVQPKNAGARGTMVGFWRTDPRIFLSF